MSTLRQAIKAILRARMRPVFQGMTDQAFDMRCCEILDDEIKPGSPCFAEIERMETGFTLSRMICEVRRELRQEAAL